MGDALPADIKRIIDQQTQPQRPLPNSITRAVLPKIGMSADSSLAPARGRPPTPGRPDSDARARLTMAGWRITLALTIRSFLIMRFCRERLCQRLTVNSRGRWLMSV
ncbi:unnamed protein product [Nippostrongylus brasiliensis]|uniref:Transposase n=1 Tax=Nippostrongylus brasiliensis TaxID=27835 RepID=A0A0N4YF04_NIPBR|nr:unnamed protein product [Nippostrongylus brasiliensis]